MSVGPIEVIVVNFPGNRFNGAILPELNRLVETGTISILDGLLATRDADGAVTVAEVDDASPDPGIAALAALFDRLDALVSEDDVNALVEGLEPNSSAAVLVFEHTWAKPFRDAIVGSGGVLAAQVRIPPDVVAEVMDALASQGATS